MDVRVGIDFGTHQTKVCVNYKKGNQPQVFEFVNFGTESAPNFFLPSQLNIHKDNSISVGNSDENEIQSYKYFKIASAEDKEFKGISGFDRDESIYDLKRYDDLTPELLSILYLSHVIGFVKKSFKSRHEIKKKPAKQKSFWGKFFGRDKDKEGSSEKQNFNFHYQIGIPTEWSAKKNRWRRRKFEQILYLALDVLEIHSYSEIQSWTLPEVKSKVNQSYKALHDKLKALKWEDLLREHQISAFPETAAGLTYLVKTKKISEGYYIALDIGGGSSDVSFFRVKNNRTFEYLASESLLIASNNLFDHYMQNSDQLSSTEQAQQYLERREKSELDEDEKYQKAFHETIEQLSDRIKKIYNERVYFRFKETIANTKFDEQSCYLYGGGSLLHKPQRNPNRYLKEILLHDNGTQSITGSRTYAKVDEITDLDPVQEVKPKGWKQHLPLLIVPLGLSFIQPDQTYEWNDKFYESGEGFYDINKDPEMFDIYRRRWV